MTFDKPITSATASVTEGNATAGTPTYSGNDVVVGLTGVTNAQYVTISLTNVVAADGGTGGSGSVRIGFLAGDVNQNRVVTVSDLAQVNAQIAQVVGQANYLKDVNASGTLTVADKGIANTQITKALPDPGHNLQSPRSFIPAAVVLGRRKSGDRSDAYGEQLPRRRGRQARRTRQCRPLGDSAVAQQIKVTIPVSVLDGPAGDIAVTVVNPGSGAIADRTSNSTSFLLTDPPLAVTSITPARGSPGRRSRS